MRNFFRHLHTINKHKWLVFKLSLVAGIPFRGLLHDLSKYSPSEFFESVKYYSGVKSPYSSEKKDIGYAPGWLHHKGRNKHHHEYWYDYDAPISCAIMPFKYFVEMICDNIAACQNYKGKDFTLSSPLEYFNEKTVNLKINEHIKKSLYEVFCELEKKDIKSTINKANLRKIYNRNLKSEVKNENRKNNN